MKRLKSIKYITRLAVIIAILLLMSLPTIFVSIDGKSIFQIADGLFLAFCALIPGIGMLIVGVIYSTIIDVMFGSPIYIPISIIIHILMYLIVIFLKKIITPYGAFVIASLMVLLYVPYVYVLYEEAHALIELVIDAIQFGVTVFVSFIFYYVLNKPNIKRVLFTDNNIENINDNISEVTKNKK